ncbi:LOB domain-containing protein 42-like [Punica granatum]|uniref:LOB domain-containing protein n=2 Tax=Punica granatum TaxID=22663 RepID=A0A218W5Q8_PUNGR|nr:LOB domain-containing protein 42-like [Punica granatum]OWM67976.1 hypothetical protein CDL15_Pgr017544 [Punica granatum]PKI73036.1 hypothetical protein CRG98_006587 [Punica granatum]
MSCNGCRVLRKGCSDDCPIRPCLQWIKSADAQANATMFLAKFYGRAGLLNLINAGPDHLRPAIFRSLLYEACGRIINPIYGSVGLLWSGNWAQCQSAVDSVLKGTSQFMQIPSSDILGGTAELAVRALKCSCDIRHIKKSASSVSQDLRKAHHRTQYKRIKLDSELDVPKPSLWICPAPIYEETSHRENVSTEDESNFSAETIEDSLVAMVAKGTKSEQIWKFSGPTVEKMPAANRESTLGLELTLGLNLRGVHGQVGTSIEQFSGP